MPKDLPPGKKDNFFSNFQEARKKPEFVIQDFAGQIRPFFMVPLGLKGIKGHSISKEEIDNAVEDEKVKVKNHTFKTLEEWAIGRCSKEDLEKFKPGICAKTDSLILLLQDPDLDIEKLEFVEKELDKILDYKDNNK